jgi:hypothetical protein
MQATDKTRSITVDPVCNTDRTLTIDLNSYLPSGTPQQKLTDDGSNALNKKTH